MDFTSSYGCRINFTLVWNNRQKTSFWNFRWEIFPSPYYEGTRSAELLSGGSSLKCINSKFPYKSFRNLGSIDTELDVLSLYSKTDYGGEEIIVNGDGPVKGIGIQIQSVGWTGNSGSWTVYEGGNLDGKSTFLHPINKTIGYSGYYHLTRVGGLSTIGSLIKGRPGDCSV